MKIADKRKQNQMKTAQNSTIVETVKNSKRIKR